MLSNEAETDAGRIAIKMRYEKEAEAEGVDVKKLAEEQSRELEELESSSTLKKTQLESLVEQPTTKSSIVRLGDLFDKGRKSRLSRQLLCHGPQSQGDQSLNQRCSPIHSLGQCPFLLARF